MIGRPISKTTKLYFLYLFWGFSPFSQKQWQSSTSLVADILSSADLVYCRNEPPIWGKKISKIQITTNIIHVLVLFLFLCYHTSVKNALSLLHNEQSMKNDFKKLQVLSLPPFCLIIFKAWKCPKNISMVLPVLEPPHVCRTSALWCRLVGFWQEQRSPSHSAVWPPSSGSLGGLRSSHGASRSCDSAPSISHWSQDYNYKHIKVIFILRT